MNQPPDPRTLPGNLAARRYLGDAPDTAMLRLTVAILYIAGGAIIVLRALICAWLIVLFWTALSLLFNSPSPAAQTFDILKAAAAGLVIGFLLALPFFVRAQMLALYIRIEENTRQAKELLYLLVSDRKRS